MADNPSPQGNDEARQDKKGFGPIFKPRGSATKVTSCAVIIGGLLLIRLILPWIAVKEEQKEKEEAKEKEETMNFLFFTTALITFNSVLGEQLRRLILVVEEFRHKDTRYQGNWKRVFKAIFPVKHLNRSLWAAILSGIILWYEDYEAFSRQNIVLLSLNCLVVPQLLFVVGLRQPSPVETANFNEKENKTVADGLVWSYYFGYLKLALPHLGTQIDQSDFRDMIPVHMRKVFILLPKNCIVHANINEADPRVKWVGDLPQLELDVAGKKRGYRHVVYKIENRCPDGTVEECHFILEYAASLKTFYEMSLHAATMFDSEEQGYQVVLFIQKLMEIMKNSPECKDRCELVLISGDDRNEISTVLMKMHNAPKREVHNPEANGVHRPEQLQLITNC